MQRGDRRYRLCFAGILVAAIAIRVVYDLAFADSLPVGGDAYTYHILGDRLAHGDGFTNLLNHQTAEHPPLYPLLLALGSKLGAGSWDGHRIVSSVAGTGTVALVGMLASRLGSARTGLIAAAIAAAYPLLFIAEGEVYSEALYGLLIAAVLLAGYRLLDRPRAGRAILLGLAIGLAALTRAEAMLLIVLLGAPIAARASADRLKLFAIVAAVAVVTVLPWTIRSSIALHHPVLISTNFGGLVAGANCDQTYYGDRIGLWNERCWPPVSPISDEATAMGFRRQQGINYALGHASRVPVVVLVRVLRGWDLFRPEQGVGFAAFEGRPWTASRIGLGFYYPMLVLAIGGAWLMRRRSAELVLLLAPVALVTVTFAISYGITRFRLPAEIPLLVLGVLALDRLASQVAARVRPRRPRLRLRRPRLRLRRRARRRRRARAAAPTARPGT